MDLLFLFEWLDQSWLASVAKSWGGVFAVVQAVHLLSMALLGGMVMAGDLRMLGIVLRDVEQQVVVDHTGRWINLALLLLVASGIFMMSAVAIKLYYNYFFWTKMLALGLGIIYVYAVRRPLFRLDPASVDPWALRLTAVASLCIWFTVAACGRWIGFS